MEFLVNLCQEFWPRMIRLRLVALLKTPSMRPCFTVRSNGHHFEQTGLKKQSEVPWSEHQNFEKFRTGRTVLLFGLQWTLLFIAKQNPFSRNSNLFSVVGWRYKNHPICHSSSLKEPDFLIEKVDQKEKDKKIKKLIKLIYAKNNA